MCGIAGELRRDTEPPGEIVEEMTRALRHRGPDGEGFYRDESVALGMRRLAIIDPDGGQQPLFDERREIAVVFNGEIYNHAELRRRLIQAGHRIESGSDGAILPHLYEEHGERFVELLEGIFAIALWDRRRGRLHLARDPLGVKPLYWAATRKSLLFASECRALLLSPELPRELDYGALDLFLSLRFIPSPRTPFAAIHKLSPGTILTAGTGAGEPSERRYWLGEMSAARRDAGALIDEYEQAFERAVVSQMMSDRPIGVMLSGGVDSAAITAVMARHSTRVRTFTIGFSEGGDANEVPLAEHTARLLGTDHTSLVVDSDEYLRRLPVACQSLEEPVGTSSALAVNFVAEMMRGSVPVALCGQGADEPLGGYWRHAGCKIATTLRPFSTLTRPAGRLLASTRSARLRRGLELIEPADDLQLLMRTYTLISPQLKERLYRPVLTEAREPADPFVERFRARVAGLDPLSQMLFVDTRLWLPDEFLMIADKMSMAASVELRVPYLDRRLLGLIESMHPSLKVRGLTRKWIHKRAVERLLPREIVHRRERGWATPMGQWLRQELRPMLEELLLDPTELGGQLFQAAECRRLIDDHVDGRADHQRQLFAMLSLGLWHRSVPQTPKMAAV